MGRGSPSRLAAHWAVCAPILGVLKIELLAAKQPVRRSRQFPRDQHQFRKKESVERGPEVRNLAVAIAEPPVVAEYVVLSTIRLAGLHGWAKLISHLFAIPPEIRLTAASNRGGASRGK